jgi:HAD superfamily hydrolase (TIGR01490 family)
MALAIFDLDNTLLGGDSDYLWGEFLVENNYVDAEYHQKMNDHFYQQYLAGKMDIYEFSAFQFQPLVDNDINTLYSWRDEYLTTKIAPIMLPAAQALIEQHKQAGDTLLIITATNSFITAPIAEQLEIPNLIATEAEIVNEKYTGKVAGIPSYQAGKVSRLNDWLAEQKISLEGSYFYSDSHNDLPLLKLVDHPIAVDCDDTLANFANKEGWKIISLR